MKREEQIRQAALAYSFDTDGGHSGDLNAGRDDFTEGAKWADEHPVKFWHKVADGDLPLKAKNNNRVEFSVEVLVRLDKNRLAFGRYDYTYKSWYIGLQRVYPTHWAEIPKLPENNK